MPVHVGRGLHGVIKGASGALQDFVNAPVEIGSGLTGLTGGKRRKRKTVKRRKRKLRKSSTKRHSRSKTRHSKTHRHKRRRKRTHKKRHLKTHKQRGGSYSVVGTTQLGAGPRGSSARGDVVVNV